MATTDRCEACHLVSTVDHQEVNGACAECHAAPQNHSNANVQQDCVDCHQVSSWLNPTQSLPQPVPST